MKTRAAVGLVAAATLLSACGGGQTGIESAVESCGIEGASGFDVGDGGNTLSIDGKGEDDASGADITDIACVLKALDVSDAVISRIDSTRALDGRQEGSWEGYTATWGYHPDSGLDLVIEVER